MSLGFNFVLLELGSSFALDNPGAKSFCLPFSQAGIHNISLVGVGSDMIMMGLLSIVGGLLGTLT